ncbi:hypothetical protein OL548_05980 [Lysinibacillus sp. MHQ-1]|nr:hypothetical protein OL548_05980 [Lysinibacillus sp. MHQ-1]
MMKWLLVIDGGATKNGMCSRSRRNWYYGIFSFNKGLQLSSHWYGSSYSNITRAFSKGRYFFYKKHAGSQIAVATFALAGIDSPKDKEMVTAIIQNALSATQLSIANLIIENDAEATLLGVTAGQAGALLIAGTGAIAYAYDGQQMVRAGGWGHRAGDEGSGFWLGQEVVRAIFKMEDGRGETTILKEAVFHSLGIQNVTELAEWLFQPSYTNAQLAKLGSFVAQAVEQQDACAIHISRQAAQELALLAKAVLKKSRLSEWTVSSIL